MCGVPVHSADGYLARLIRKGFKVAICEQMEDPAEAKKRGGKSVVKRGVVRVVTPGTITEDALLDARAHNYLRSEEHTSELQSLMRISYAVFCLKKKRNNKTNTSDSEDTAIYSTVTYDNN